MRMSLAFSNSTNTAFPSGDFMLIVIDRLLQLSIVKYRLSAFGTSRNCPRVASPAGDSSLITSAPIQASSCEHVGPACTCVMSRTRIPLSASIYLISCVSPHLDRGHDRAVAPATYTWFGWRCLMNIHRD